MKKKINVSFIQYHDEGFGGWATGIVYVNSGEYQFETKHFQEGSCFGIDNGRVSKLRIVRRYPHKPVRVVCEYDREWYRRPNRTSPYDMAAYNAILERYN